jgi:replication factor C large subunit
VAFRPPSLWRRMGQTRSARNLRDSAATKIGRHCHVSSRMAKSELMGFFGLLLKDKASAPKVAALLELEPEEIALLMGSKPTTKKVARIYEEAQRLLEEERIAEIEFGWSGPAKKEDKTETQKIEDTGPNEKTGKIEKAEKSGNIEKFGKFGKNNEADKAVNKAKNTSINVDSEAEETAEPEKTDQAESPTRGQKSLFDF